MRVKILETFHSIPKMDKYLAEIGIFLGSTVMSLEAQTAEITEEAENSDSLPREIPQDWDFDVEMKKLEELYKALQVL